MSRHAAGRGQERLLSAAQTDDALERDLADELAHHLDALEAEAIADGADSLTSRAEALRRFGDPERVRTACRHIAHEDQIMLQRVHTILTIVLLLAVGALGVHTVVAQRTHVRTLEELHHTMGVLVSERDKAPETAPAARAARHVYLAGDVPRPGSYELPDAGLSGQRLLAAAGVSSSDAFLGVIIHRGSSEVRLAWPPSTEADDISLEVNDLIVVKNHLAETPGASSLQSNGIVIPPPMDLTALDRLSRADMQARLALVAKARMSRAIDDATKSRLKNEFDTLLVAVRESQR